MWARFRRNRGALIGSALAGLVSAATAISLHDADNRQLVSKTILGKEELSPMSSSSQELRLQEAITKSRILIGQLKEKSGAPGISVGVSVNGVSVWQEGFGYSDLENRVPCTSSTVMRIASISKSITMAAVAMLWERGQLDIDKPVHEYVPDFPKKKYTLEGKETTLAITSRHLASHQSGVRHYKKNRNAADQVPVPEIEDLEFCSKEKFKTVADSLKIFQDDPLWFEPGTDFHYTTHGFTLLTAVVEKVSGEPFAKFIRHFFAKLGLKHTYLDENGPLIYNRSRFYVKRNGQLENAPYVDSSYKWGGGGYLSDIGDLLQFGNIMLYAAGFDDGCSTLRCPPGFLKADTINSLWTPTSLKPIAEGSCGYGLGWGVCPQRSHLGMCSLVPPKKIVAHDGGAMGGSSTIVLRLPNNGNDASNVNENFKVSNYMHGIITDGSHCLPRGIVVTMLANLNGVRLGRVAFEIAELFDKASAKSG